MMIVSEHAPSNVAVRRVSSTAIEVSWTPLNLTEAQGIISGYFITYGPATSIEKRSAQEQRTLIAGPDQQSYVIEDLEVGTLYSVTVAVVTEAGVGPICDAVYEEGNSK